MYILMISFEEKNLLNEPVLILLKIEQSIKLCFIFRKYDESFYEGDSKY